MEEVQLVAQRVHDDSQSSQHQLGVAESRVNELLMTVSQQAEPLEAQRREQTGMTQMILELQHQVTLLRQSSTPAQDQNATAIDMSPIMKEMQSLRNELALMKQTPSLNYPVFPMTRSASPTQSACAGIPHESPQLPIQKSGQDFWSISTPAHPPQPPGSNPSSSSSSDNGRGPGGGYLDGNSPGGGYPGGNSPGRGFPAGGSPGGGPPPGG